MPVNAHPDYIAAEGEYHKAQTLEERIEKLRKMISLAPAHKSAENLRAELKNRLKRFEEKLEKNKKTGKSGKAGIKKEEMQAVVIGFTNSGKSSLLNKLTNVETKVSSGNFSKYTTKSPIIGMMPYVGMLIQIIENPSPDSEYYDKGLTNSADTLMLLINSLEEISKLKEYVERAKGKIIIIFNKSDQLTESELRKIESTLKSKKHNFQIISTKTKEGISELKEKIFKSFNKIRVFTKEPGKQKSEKPIVLNPGSTVYDVSEKIFHGFSSQVKEAFVTGPSSKFPYQKVGLKHKLKDMDIIEFKTKN